MRAVRIFLYLACAIALCGLAGLWIARSHPDSHIGLSIRDLFVPGQPGTAAGAGALPAIAIGGDFSLVDPAGRTVHPSSYPGRYLLIYFGYTSCPDICPTTLQQMADALHKLGPRAAAVQPLFITVDPQRDTPARLASYTALFGANIIGLTGTPAQIAAAEAAWRVYAAPVQQPGTTGYLMDHTSFIYLMRPDGTLQAMFGRDVTAATLADAMAKALG